MAKKSPTTQRDRVLIALSELGHPTRLLVLEATANGPTSPKAIHDANPQHSLGTISYHVRAMADDKLIRLRSRKQVRGAIAHFYVITPKGQKVLDTVIAQ